VVHSCCNISITLIDRSMSEIAWFQKLAGSALSTERAEAAARRPEFYGRERSSEFPSFAFRPPRSDFVTKTHFLLTSHKTVAGLRRIFRRSIRLGALFVVDRVKTSEGRSV
jgi:hypothetical protein